MADGLLGLLGGGGNAGGMDLNQLVRPPDPLGDALAAMSERFAQAGQASRLPTSTLGALGSALGGASTAARAAQTQYLDQAIKLEALKRSLRQAGIDERLAPILFKQLQGGGAAPAPAVTPMPGAPRAYAPTAAPGAPPTAPRAGPVVPSAPLGTPLFSTTSGDYNVESGDVPAMGNYANPPDASTLPPIVPGAPPGFAPSNLPPGSPGTVTYGTPPVTYAPSGGGKITNTGLLGDPDQVIPSTQGGARAATTLASFRPADLVAPDGRAGNGAGDAGPGLGLIDAVQRLSPAALAAKDIGMAPRMSPDPATLASLRGLLASDDSGRADPFAGLLATDAPIQPGGPDTLIPSGDQSQLPVERASMAAPSKGDPRGMIPFIRERAQAYGVDPDTAVAVARSEGLGSFYGDGGKSGTAFQLYTGGGLGNEFQKQTGLDPLDPKNEQAAIDWALANVNRTGWTPYHGAKTVGVSDRTGLPGGDSGGGGRSNVQLAQYAPSGAGGAPPLVGPGSGMIPGLNMTPQQVAAFNALYGLAGHTGSPLKEFLDIYYKSPEYLRGATEAQKLGERAVTEPSDIRINEAKAMNDIKVGMAKDGVMIGPNGEVVPIPGHAKSMAYNSDQLEAVKNKYATKLQETAAEYEPVTVTIRNPDGSDTATTITKAELKRRQDMQGSREPRPGDIVGTRVENPFDKFGVQKFGESFDAAQGARTSLENNTRVQKLIDDGIITGTGANANLALQKLGAALGFTGHDQIARTEAFVAAMGTQVAGIIKSSKLGPPTSDADVRFAQGIAGGDIALDEQAIRRILRIHEDFNRGLIEKHNKEWAPYVPKGSMIQGTILAPPPYGAQTGTETDPQGNAKRYWRKNEQSPWVEY